MKYKEGYTALANCSEKRAEELLNVARTDRNIVSLQRSIQADDFQETGEEVAADDDWDDFGILWNSEEEKRIREALAFQILHYLSSQTFDTIFSLLFCVKCPT